MDKKTKPKNSGSAKGTEHDSKEHKSKNKSKQFQKNNLIFRIFR